MHNLHVVDGDVDAVKYSLRMLLALLLLLLLCVCVTFVDLELHRSTNRNNVNGAAHMVEHLHLCQSNGCVHDTEYRQHSAHKYPYRDIASQQHKN